MHGTVDAIDTIYDGVAMYKELRLLNDEAMPKGQRDAVKQMLTDMEKKPLRENCTDQEFANRINKFNREINPFLDRPYDGVALSEFIIDQIVTTRSRGFVMRI